MKIIPSNNLTLLGFNKFFLSMKKLYDDNILPNKIILSGNSGIGKSTFAYHLINYIFSNKEEFKYNFDENLILSENRSYNLVSKNNHPNFFLISNDDDKKSIQISKVRDMINFTNKSSFNDDCKIILIDNIEYLNVNSINALLKVIEEPNDKIFFLLIHNSKSKILDTLVSRCIKFNLFLNENDRLNIINKVLNSNFYNDLNNDFKNLYDTPGDMFLLSNFFKINEIDPSITIEKLFNIIIQKKLYKKDLYIKNELSFFIEIYFKKKLYNLKSKNKIYGLYKYFLLRAHNCKKYNLDIESIFIEINGKLLNE